MLQEVIQFAYNAHNGQTRRDHFTPYISHPQNVAERLRGESDEIIMTAWLHDVLEDTKETPDSMRAAGIPEPVIEAVQVLTKTEGEDYSVYLARVKAHPIARKVKIADMLSNLGDSPTDKQIIKYAYGLILLVDE